MKKFLVLTAVLFGMKIAVTAPVAAQQVATSQFSTVSTAKVANPPTAESVFPTKKDRPSWVRRIYNSLTTNDSVTVAKTHYIIDQMPFRVLYHPDIFNDQFLRELRQEFQLNSAQCGDPYKPFAITFR
jgi:hypothetical protein